MSPAVPPAAPSRFILADSPSTVAGTANIAAAADAANTATAAAGAEQRANPG